MSIIDTFDSKSQEIILAKQTTTAIENFPKKVIAVFTENFVDYVIKTYSPKIITTLKACSLVPVYSFDYNGEEIAFYKTPIGAPATVGVLEQIFALGGEKVLFFGSCGALDKDIVSGKLIVPTMAYRDEGTSYHYAPPSDYIEVKSSQKLTEVLDKLNIKYTTTKTWTTDAFFRETYNNMQKRKNDGCKVVEMECSAIMATADFRNKNVYQFLYTADQLDGQTWDERILEDVPKSLEEKLIKTSLLTIQNL